MPTAAEANRIASAQPRVESIEYGPWLGSMRSVPAEQVPPEWLANPSQSPVLDFKYRVGIPKLDGGLPEWGYWKRRGGQSIKFDTHGSVVGLLPAKWSGRVRHVEEFLSDSVTDGIPTVCALVTKETIASGLDDGRFANFWWEDQVNGLERTLCDEYSSTTYPAPGSIQYYRVPAIWYESGDGGLTRGVTEFARRFFLSGARRFQKVGRQWYFPGYRGTPTRWNGIRSSGTSGTLTVQSTLSCDWGVYTGAGGTSSTTNDTTRATAVQTNDDDTLYIGQSFASGNNPAIFLLNGVIPTGVSTFTVNVRQRFLSAPPGGAIAWTMRIVRTDGKYFETTHPDIHSDNATTSWATTAFTIDATGAGTTGGTANSIAIYSPNTSAYCLFTYVEVTWSGGTGVVNRLMPSGPIPPCFAGTVAPGTTITEAFTYPNGDGSIGAGWLNSAAVPDQVNMYSYVDEVTADDTDYIRATNTNTECHLNFATPSTLPQVGDVVTIRYRASAAVTSGHNTLQVYFYTGSTVASVQGSTTWTATSANANYGFQLTDADITNITNADPTWASVSVKLRGDSLSAGDSVSVTQLRLGVLPGAANAEGGWKGKDRFLVSHYYRFEDDSVWALTTPRFPNSNLANGLSMVTVDSANPDVAFNFIRHSNIPVPPAGVKKVGICRSPKIDSTVDDNLQLNPYDMRLIAEVDPGTLTYDDYTGDDDALGLDISEKFIRFDHKMPPRCAYNAAGDMRMVHGKGSQSPAAIVIAPVGVGADYDLNLADTAAALYNQNSSYMRLSLATTGVMTLELLEDTGAATTSTNTIWTSTDFPTIQGLVDKINSTTVATHGRQWRAQLLPDVSPDAAMTSLCPHTRDIASVVTTSGSASITKAAGGLSKVAVGAYITGTGVTAGTYVTRIDSDTQLTMSANATASGTVTLTFYFRLGDDPTSLSNTGYQRVLGNALPGFLYFNTTYLNNFPTEKNATWMTVANPGSVRCAPNCFITTAQTRSGNKFTPPLDAGNLTGVAAVDQGFVVLYANKKTALRPRDATHLNDEDFGLVVIDENEGCVAWNTVVSGNRFAIGMDSGGMFGADLFNVRRFSKRIWAKPSSDATTGVGDFSYEIPQSIAATAQDNDSSYATARVIGSVVWVCYRTSASTTHANRVILYDFSAADETTGLKALFRSNGEEWGWSTPFAYGTKIALVGSGRRSGSSTEGLHVYGWNDENAGTTGDGRLDELETGETDNSTAISTGTVSIPWIQADEGEMISVQRVILEHNSPTGSTGSLKYHRSYSNDSYTLTPGTSSLDLLSELKHLTTPARALTAAGYFEYLQASGSARELRKLKVFLHRVKRLR